jgi:serine/threonine protein kinase
MAPELLNFGERQTSCDIYSFGLTLYETCLIPSPRSSLPVSGSLWMDLRQGRIDSVSTVHCARPSAIDELISYCLVIDPDKRASAAQLIELDKIRRSGELTRDVGNVVLMSAPIRNPIVARISRSTSYQQQFELKRGQSLSIECAPIATFGENFEESMKTPTTATYLSGPFIPYGFAPRKPSPDRDTIE